jgi:hypothetical protein
VKFVSPLHLHKGLSGAYTAMLVVVPPCAGECRFVRVIPVLIFFGARTCGGFVFAPSPHGRQVRRGQIDADGNVMGKLAALLDAADPEFVVDTP